MDDFPISRLKIVGAHALKAVCALSLLSGCAGLNRERDLLRREVASLRTQLSRAKRQNASLQNERDKLKVPASLACERSPSATIVQRSPIASSDIPSEASAVAPSMPPVPPVPLMQIVDDGQATTEHVLYSTILAAHRRKDVESLRKARNLLAKSYPDSPFGDNAAFLEGQLALDSGNREAAIQVFDALLRQYPSGNKAPAALFAKAIALRELGIRVPSRAALRALTRLYPGSPEALQADRRFGGDVRAPSALRADSGRRAPAAG